MPGFTFARGIGPAGSVIGDPWRALGQGTGGILPGRAT
jgi:hypothetical protein